MYIYIFFDKRQYFTDVMVSLITSEFFKWKSQKTKNVTSTNSRNFPTILHIGIQHFKLRQSK